jgi:formylglycine-generating enzyme required for sulfatase activity
VKANSKWRRSEVKRLFADPDYLQLWADDHKLGSQADGNAPVKYVSWFAAKACAQWKRQATSDDR